MDDKILEILKDIQGDIKNIKGDIKNIQGDIKNIKVDIKNIKVDIKDLKTQVSENTQILKALEHSSEVNKAEHDKMSNDIAKIQGDTAKIRKDLSFVEQATAKNWRDIAELKIVK